MSRKQPIPDVDEAALAELAGQFPSGFLRPQDPPAPGKAPAPQQDPATRQESATQQDRATQQDPATPQNKEPRDVAATAPAASAAARPKAPGRGLAVFAVLLALIAVVIAATPMMPPPARSWLVRTLGNSGVVTAFVTGNRAGVDTGPGAAQSSIDALARRQADMAARLQAVETVIGSGAAMRRLDAVEAGLAEVHQRLAAAGDIDKLTAARATALDAKLASFASDLKTIQDKQAADEKGVNQILTARLGAVEADVGALEKIDRRPEKFFLAALQLRDRVRTAKPFAHEAAVAQALAGKNPDLASSLKILSGDAVHGVATVAELRENFTSIVEPRLAALAAADQQPVTERAWGWVQSWFTTAAPAQPTDDRNAALIALAARSLNQGQLEPAVHQLLLLEDEAALVAAEWLKNASTRIAADKAIATVMSQALDQLAASN